MSTTLGTAFSCRSDFTSTFAVCKTDKEIAFNEVLHRLTTDSVLGDSEEAMNYGFDVRQRLGARMSDEDIAALGPLLSSVLQRSGRLDTADVVCTRLAGTPGLLSLTIAVDVTIVTGETFAFLFRLSGSTFEQVGAT